MYAADSGLSTLVRFQVLQKLLASTQEELTDVHFQVGWISSGVIGIRIRSNISRGIAFIVFFIQLMVMQVNEERTVGAAQASDLKDRLEKAQLKLQASDPRMLL